MPWVFFRQGQISNSLTSPQTPDPKPAVVKDPRPSPGKCGAARWPTTEQPGTVLTAPAWGSMRQNTSLRARIHRSEMAQAQRNADEMHCTVTTTRTSLLWFSWEKSSEGWRETAAARPRLTSCASSFPPQEIKKPQSHLSEVPLRAPAPLNGSV